MKQTETELLNNIYQATEMGRDGIDAMLKYADEPPLRRALEQQKTEYEKLYAASEAMLQERGETPKGINPVAKASTGVMSAMQTMMNHSTSKIAEMMVQGNTMGMTKSLQTIHAYQGGDEQVRALADKLLATEQANIEQMKQFL